MLELFSNYLNKIDPNAKSDNEILNTVLSSQYNNGFDVQKFIEGGKTFEILVKSLGGNPTAEAVKNFKDSYNATLVGKQITPSTVSNSVTNNNSNTNNTNNKSIVVNTGDMVINVPENMSKEEIAEYVAGRLSDSIAMALPKYLV